MSAAPFVFQLNGGFTAGANTAQSTPTPASSSSVTDSTVLPPCRPDAFPANLHAPSLPACPLLHATPALHPLRGRVLVSTRAFQPGEVVLHEHAFMCSNWDSFRCAECDKPHMTRSCMAAKKKWAKKVLAKMDSVEESLKEAECIGEIDHVRSFIKLLNMYIVESTIGVNPSNGSPLSDFFSLSYTHFDQARKGLLTKLPYQSSTPKEILEHAGLWPSGLSVDDAARMLAILNTNSHELSDIRGTGIFLRASLMEHSCAPNCNFSTTGRELQILALRPIAAGENLSIDYGMGLYRPVSARREGLRRSHGFTCFCVACTQHPDRSRAFTCPTVVNGQPCTGVIYPVGVDDRASEEKAWRELIAEAASNVAQSSQQALPAQPFDTNYPQPAQPSWSCTTCKYVLNQAQREQALQREHEAAKKLKSYKDDDEDDEKAQFNFDGSDDDEDDGDEIRNPTDLVKEICSQPAPSLHPSHHLIFWAVEFYARSASADSEFAEEAIPLFEQILGYLRSFIAPLGQELHDSLMIYADYLAQVFVVTGRIDDARKAFEMGWKYSCALNGANHHSSLDLKALVDDTPGDAEELQMQYARFNAAMEALIYDTQVAATKKKAGNKKKKKKGAGKARDAISDDDDDDDFDVDEPGADITITRQNQVEILQHMEKMILSQGKDEEGDEEMGENKKPAKKKNKKNKKK